MSAGGRGKPSSSWLMLGRGRSGPAVNLGAFKWFSPVEDGGADVERDPGGSPSQAGSGRGPDGPVRPGVFRLSPGLRGLRRRLSGRRHGRAAAPVHPSQPGLRRHLLRHRLRRLPIHGDGRDRLAAAADRLRRSLPPLRRRVPATTYFLSLRRGADPALAVVLGQRGGVIADVPNTAKVLHHRIGPATRDPMTLLLCAAQAHAADRLVKQSATLSPVRLFPIILLRRYRGGDQDDRNCCH